MTIHFQINSKGIFRFILSGLTISAIFIILFALLSCRITVEGEPYHHGREPYHHGPGARTPAPLPGIEGPWLINAYNLPGRLEFYWTGNTWTGRIWFDILSQWEELTNIFIDPSTGQIQFFRPAFQQQYSGTLSGNRIVGEVVSGIGSWAGSLPWEAWRR